MGRRAAQYCTSVTDANRDELLSAPARFVREEQVVANTFSASSIVTNGGYSAVVNGVEVNVADTEDKDKDKDKCCGCGRLAEYRLHDRHYLAAARVNLHWVGGCAASSRDD